MFAETRQIYDRRQQHAHASSISEDTCPTDCFQRAICQADIVNEKDTDGQQHCPREENPRDSTFRFLAECHPRLQSSKYQGEIAKIDHVDVSIDLGAAIFEKGPDIRQV